MSGGKHASDGTPEISAVELRVPGSRRALAEPPTRRALRRYLMRGFALLGVFVILFIVFGLDVALFTTPDTGIRTAIACTLGAVTFLVLIIGLCVVLNTIRMAFVLARHPWIVWNSHYREVISGEPTLFLGDDGEHVLTLVALRNRWAPLSHSPSLWLAGSPRRGGVVSTPGGEYLVWCRRPMMKVFRNWLIRKKNNGVGVLPRP